MRKLDGKTSMGTGACIWLSINLINLHEFIYSYRDISNHNYAISSINPHQNYGLKLINEYTAGMDIKNCPTALDN